MDYGTTGLTSSTPAAREQSEAPPLPSGPAPDTPPPPSSATAEPVVMATNSAGNQGQPSSAPSASQLHTSFVAETLALAAPGTELHDRLSKLLAAAQVPTFAVAKTPEETLVTTETTLERLYVQYLVFLATTSYP